jgi:hypothetical protein
LLDRHLVLFFILLSRIQVNYHRNTVFSTNTVAVDFVKLNDSIDKGKVTWSVDTNVLLESIIGEEIDYKRAVDPVDKKKATEALLVF